MRPFNLEEYLKNPDRKIVTRDGLPVRIICADRRYGYDKPILALVYNAKVQEEACYGYTPNGKVFQGVDNDKDLFFAPTKHEGWINVYRDDDDYYMGAGIYSTEEEAREMAELDKEYITTIKVEWEE